MAESKNGAARLKQDLQNASFQKLYIVCGDESYLKEYYLDQLKETVVDSTFKEFNLTELDGKTMSPQDLNDAIEGCPAMAEKKLVIITDFDLMKAPVSFEPVLATITDDLPDYICLVFFYDIMEFKPDKRTKLWGKLEKASCIANFSHLEDRELISWIRRRFKALGREIDQQTCEYMIFLCGNSMTQLVSEIEKAAAHSTTDAVKQYNIDSVCTKVLDAVVFDLSDAITQKRFDTAVSLVDELLAQKNNEVMIFTTVTRHIQRLYAAKLCEQSRRGEKQLLEMIGSKSPYYAKQIVSAARKMNLQWLRNAAKTCAETDIQLKSSAVDSKKIIDLALLSMATVSGGAS